MADTVMSIIAILLLTSLCSPACPSFVLTKDCTRSLQVAANRLSDKMLTVLGHHSVCLALRMVVQSYCELDFMRNQLLPALQSVVHRTAANLQRMGPYQALMEGVEVNSCLQEVAQLLEDKVSYHYYCFSTPVSLLLIDCRAWQEVAPLLQVSQH